MDTHKPNDASSRRAFMALLERNISTKIVLSTWCPTMDIVVLVTADQQLQSFRLNWERLWSKQPSAGITSLHWRPDGKHIAYGDEDGNVVVLAAEDGAEVERRRLFSATGSGLPSGEARRGYGEVRCDQASSSNQEAVVGLRWAVCDVDAATGRLPRSARLLGHGHEQGFAACSGTEASSHAYCTPASHNGYEVRSTWEARLARQGREEDMAKSLRLLCAVSSRGNVVVCGEGLLPILAFRMFGRGDWVDRGVGNGEGPEVGMSAGLEAGGRVHTQESISVCMSSTAEQLWVGWRDQNGVRVAKMDTSIVRQHASMIRAVGSLLSDSLKDVELMCDLMRNIGTHVGEVETAREEHLGDMRSILGGSRDPETDIYDFLIRGAYSLELKAFVGKESALKATARKVDSAMSCMYHDIVYHLQPCLERIAFRLGDLRGHSMTPDGARVLGLRRESVDAVERWALDFVALVEHARELVLKVASGYRNFYALLSMLQHRENGEKYPSLPRSAIQEVEELITSRYYSAELEAILSSIADGAGGDGAGNGGGRRDGSAQPAGEIDCSIQDDERLLAAAFRSTAHMDASRVFGEGDGNGKVNEVEDGNNDIMTSYGRFTANIDEDREEAAALEHLASGLDLWLDGGMSVDHMGALVDKLRARLSRWANESGLASASPVGAFKSLLLDVVACPAQAISTLVSKTKEWNILSSGFGMLPDAIRPFSMELDHVNNLHVLAANDATFVHVRVSPDQDGVAQVHAGSLPDGRSITSCTMYWKSDSIVLTAVPVGGDMDGSLIAMVPLGDETCPVRLEQIPIDAPVDTVITRVGMIDTGRCRMRHVPGLDIVLPFAASATRSVALALFAPVNSITIYDLEEDEEEDEEEESEPEGDGSDDENIDV